MDRNSGKLGRAGASIAKGHRTVINRSEFQRMKESAVIKSKEEIKRERMEKEAMQELQQAKSKERKMKMMEREKEAKERAQKSDMEIEAEQARQHFMKEAQKQRNDQADAVKLLNTLRERASAFTVRQYQLEEQKKRVQKEKQYDDRMNMEMEVERLKALKKAEDAQVLLKEKARQDRMVLEAQIASRQKQKLLQEEAREQEGIQMKRSMQLALQEEENLMKKERVRQKEMMEIVKKENEKSLNRKMLLKQRDIEEDKAIMQHNLLKAAEARKREEELEREAQEKEKQISKLRAMQERATNKQAEEDERRARRAADDREREARKKEAEAAKKKRDQLEQMKIAHEKQHQYKKYQKAIEMQRMEEEFHRIQAQAEISRRNDQEAMKTKADARKEHCKLIRDQISEKEELRKQLRAAKYEEGAQLRQKTQAEINKMKSIQEQMIKDCERQGVDSKYLMEMKGLDMQKCVLR